MEDLDVTSDGYPASVEGNNTDKGMENVPQEAVVVFTTTLPEKFRLPDHSIVVPSYFQRLELSKLINQLLQEKVESENYGDSWKHQPFDFLVDGEILLRSSLHEYMTSHGLTAEVTLRLQYQLAVRRLREQQLPSSRDWIASLTPLPRRGLLVEASYDGHCRVHQIPPLSNADSSNAIADSKTDSVLRLPLSSTVVDVSLNQGPLVATAAFAGGAYMPSGCMQMLLGSKAGGYNVVDVWEEQQQDPDDELLKKESEGPEQCNAAAFNNYGNDDAVLVNETGAIECEHVRCEKRTIRRAVLKSTGCQGSEVTCLGISHDGVTAASGGADGKVFLWDSVPDMKDAAAQQQHREGCEHSNGCHITDSSATTGSVASLSRKRKRVTQKTRAPLSPRIRAKKPKSILRSHTDRVSDLCFPASPLRCVLYTSALDETICAWDTIVGGEPLSVWTTTRPVTSICCSPVNGSIVCSAHFDGRVRLWDIRSGSVAATMNDSAGRDKKASCESSEDPKSNGSLNEAANVDGSGTAHNSHRDPRKKTVGAEHLVLGANSRLDRRFTFGSVADRRATMHVRWCPMKEGEYWIATVSQDGMLRLRDLRSASMPLFTVEVCGRPANGQTDAEAGRWAYGEITQEKGKENANKKGPPVRLLSCGWLDSRRIVTGGSDGIVRVFTVGPTALAEQISN